MMTTYFCRGKKKNGEECGAVICKGDLETGTGVVEVLCKRGECGHHRNTIRLVSLTTATAVS